MIVNISPVIQRIRKIKHNFELNCELRVVAQTRMGMKLQRGRMRRSIVPKTFPSLLASAFNVGLMGPMPSLVLYSKPWFSDV